MTKDKLNQAGSLLTGPLEHLLGYQLRKVQNAVFQHFAEHMHPRGITPGQLGLLVLIATNPGVSQAELAREIGVERSTLGEFIDRFAARQWVERRRVPSDRRIFAIHLTPEGQRYLTEVLPDVEAHEREFTQALSTQELDTLKHLLKKLVSQATRRVK